MSEENTEERSQYLTFLMGEEVYGIPILKVREILRYETPTEIPMTPPSIRGVINLRGSVVPVVSLVAKFGGRVKADTKYTCIVIVEVDTGGGVSVMGLVADAVRQVVDLSSDDIEPAPEFGTTVHVKFLQGLGRSEGRLLLLLDVDRVLTTDELRIAEEIREAGLQGKLALDGAPESGAEARGG